MQRMPEGLRFVNCARRQRVSEDGCWPAAVNAAWREMKKWERIRAALAKERRGKGKPRLGTNLRPNQIMASSISVIRFVLDHDARCEASPFGG